MTSAPLVPFADIARAIRTAPLPRCDVVLGIGSGGATPAALIAFRLSVPLRMDWYQFRDANNKPLHASPQLLRQSLLPKETRHVLVVDDVSVSGQTLRAATARLASYQVTTLVLKGKADIVLLPHLKACVTWPWHSYCFSTT